MKAVSKQSQTVTAPTVYISTHLTPGGSLGEKTITVSESVKFGSSKEHAWRLFSPVDHTHTHTRLCVSAVAMTSGNREAVLSLHTDPLPCGSTCPEEEEKDGVRSARRTVRPEITSMSSLLRALFPGWSGVGFTGTAVAPTPAVHNHQNCATQR